MAELYTSETGELCLVLRGSAEDRILNTLRRWPYWRRADVERDPAHPELCVAVTLVTDRVHDQTVRSILQRSFGITFPAEGGSGTIASGSPANRGRRGA
jgi:hypothetical protein